MSAGAVRQARADSLLAFIIGWGCDGLESTYSELRVWDRNSLWTRANVDQALDDLAAADRIVIVPACGGNVAISVVVDDEPAEKALADDYAPDTILTAIGQAQAA